TSIADVRLKRKDDPPMVGQSRYNQGWRRTSNCLPWDGFDLLPRQRNPPGDLVSASTPREKASRGMGVEITAKKCRTPTIGWRSVLVKSQPKLCSWPPQANTMGNTLATWIVVDTLPMLMD